MPIFMDLIISFKGNASKKDGESAFDAIHNHLLTQAGGTADSLNFRIFPVDYAPGTVRLTASGGQNATGVIATPPCPPPHPPVVPGNFTIVSASKSIHGARSLKNYATFKDIDSLDELKTTLASLASGKSLN